MRSTSESTEINWASLIELNRFNALGQGYATLGALMGGTSFAFIFEGHPAVVRLP
jgi:hypothetical protein